MTAAEVTSIVSGRILCEPTSPGRSLHYAFAADLMSDVLTLTQEDVLFITGLVAPQTIRTAVVSDIHTILFVRGKSIPPAIVQLAADDEICLISTPYSMYRASGELYRAGLAPVF